MEAEFDSIVLGSDGIFDFIDDSEIAKVVLDSNSPGEICRSLVGMSYNRWSESEQRTDDITVIVIKLHASQVSTEKKEWIIETSTSGERFTEDF